jgi:hypothetical protein
MKNVETHQDKLLLRCTDRSACFKTSFLHSGPLSGMSLPLPRKQVACWQALSKTLSRTKGPLLQLPTNITRKRILTFNGNEVC